MNKAEQLIEAVIQEYKEYKATVTKPLTVYVPGAPNAKPKVLPVGTTISTFYPPERHGSMTSINVGTQEYWTSSYELSVSAKEV